MAAVTKTSFRTKCLLVGASLALTFLVLEVATRTVLRFGRDDGRFMRYASARQLAEHPERVAHNYEMRYEPHRYLGYVPTPDFAHGTLIHNSMGYKDLEFPLSKPEGEFRIVCVGGSTTYTTAVADTRASYPKCLEAALHQRGRTTVRVINAGAEGWTSYEALINVAFRIVDLEPDLVIMLCGVNDTYARIVWPPEAFQGDNAGYRAPPGDRVVMPSLLEYSAFLRVVMVRMGWMEPHFKRLTFGQDNSETFFAEEWTRQQVTGTYPSGIFREVGIETMLARNGPGYFIRNLENTLAILKSRGVPVLLASIPYYASEDASRELLRVWSHPAFVAALEESYVAMSEAAEEQGVAFFGLADAFPNKETLFVDGIHLNEEGVRLKAELIAAFLLDAGLV